GRPGGELLLVAPNVVEVERTLAVDPSDFRLWVCLHEGTHRLQFTAVPWLGDYLQDSVGRLVDALDLDPKVLRDRVAVAVRELARATKGESGGQGILGLIQGERSKAIMDEITAVMSLVEGHADYVMDAVGPEVVPSVKAIRAKFTHRREGSGALDRMIRKLLGIDVKMRQYAEGSAFVRSVVEATGMDGFNAVWRSKETLPSYSELRAPADWIERVHGFRPAESA
ncbi:MAG TPA: zinc-dependent metalloprotease, partial [Mycobacteriales bacterium]|nr:zinc-dependent metalloprotease [Mycobacteriales bacterium]